MTDLGNARNNINVLSSDVVVACGAKGAGTVSEIALAIKAKKPVILLGASDEGKAFFRQLGGELLHVAETPEAVITLIKELHNTF